MTLTLFVPGCFPPTTGAIVFDTRLADALRTMGVDITLVPVAGRHPLPDDAARSSAADLWHAHQRSHPEGRVIIDGFCLYAFEGLEDALHAAGAIGLMHHPMSQEPQLPEAERAVFARIERQILPLLAHIVVPSEPTRAQLAAAITLPPETMSVMTPGIPEAERSAGSGGPTCHLLAIASLIPRKGHEVVLKALAGLMDLDWTLTICGDETIDPAHAALLRQLAEAPPLTGRVTFAGACSPERMEVLWRSADIFVSGSYYEGYGMAVAEAVRHGLPLALTQGAAAAEVIPLDGSVIVEPGDYVQLGKGLRRLIFSPALRRELGDAVWKAGRALPSWTDQAKRFTDLLAR